MDFLFKPHKELLILLSEHKVDFLLIGGYSVIFYGYNRGTNDMDLWLKPDNANRAKLLNALQKFGIQQTDLKTLSEVDFTKTSMFHIGKKPYRVDFLTKVQNVAWDDAIKNVKLLPFQNILVPIVGYNELVLMKITSDRLKDKADVEELQKIRKAKNKN
jgi:hypothetical protein